jgi:Tfp pilus assembly protein FimT
VPTTRWAQPTLRTSRRSAFTLLEITLALAVLVVLISLVWPAMMGYIAEQTIREQAHIVRVELSRARGRAIDTGLIYQFRYEPGGRRFVVLPMDRPDTAAGNTTDQAEAATATTTVVQVPVVSGQLPERCRFDVPLAVNAVTGVDTPAVTEQLPQEWLALVPDGALLQQTAWAPAIRFLPDGAADDASLTIVDDQDRRIEVWVRGFTGSVFAGPLKRETR